MVKKTAKKVAKKAAVKKTTTKTIQEHRGKAKSQMKKTSADTSRIVPDTSILVQGVLSKELLNVPVKEIIIHEAVMAELEAQANKKREAGYLGLDEVEELKNMSETQGFTLSFAGSRPAEFEIRFAKSGEIDSLIRDLALEKNAVLYTGDVVQAKVAKARGIPVILYHQKIAEQKMHIEDFFDAQTMSVHIKENTKVVAKKGKPGAWKFAIVREQLVTRAEVRQWEQEIIGAGKTRKDGFVEIERKGSIIAQVGSYRIVITKPPFADGYEITAVRPVKKLEFEEYKLSTKLQERIDKQAEGILIAGAPGHGKSTFAQALAMHYVGKEKIIKTVEAPRDMVLPDEITQYAISHGSAEEVHDVLLLSRPDYTFFDEMRNTDDFKLFADMRLSGVGMIGVMHATKPIEAIQRFLGRIELGVIPHVVDTVVFIHEGAVGNIFSVSMTVKVPSGMSEADLARPVVEVHDFETGTLKYEVYTYGEQTVVIPVQAGGEKKAMHKFAESGFQKFFEQYSSNPHVEVLGDNKLKVTVSEGEASGLIGRGGEHIQKLEQELGMSINVDTYGEDGPRRTKGADERRGRDERPPKMKRRGKQGGGRRRR